MAFSLVGFLYFIQKNRDTIEIKDIYWLENSWTFRINSLSEARVQYGQLGVDNAVRVVDIVINGFGVGVGVVLKPYSRFLETFFDILAFPVNAVDAMHLYEHNVNPFRTTSSPDICVGASSAEIIIIRK